MSLGHSPAVRRTRLGAELKALREERGESVRSLAAKVGMDPGRLSRLENGKAPRPDAVQVMDILDALGVLDPKREAIITLCRAANARGWWKALTGKSFERMRGIAEVEAGAIRTRQCSTMVVPGLLQTAAYARELITQFEGWGYANQEDIDEAAQARATRQALLTDPGFTYEVLLDQAVLWRYPCSRATMVGQLDYLASVHNVLPNVTIRLLPLAGGYTRYLPVNDIILYDYPDPEDPTVAFLETNFVDLLLDDAEDVARYEKAYATLREGSLNPEESRKVILAEATKFRKKGLS